MIDRLRRLPLRARLVAGFVGAMVVVLVAAGAFVFWRVQVALDHRLDDDLRSQTSDLRAAAERQPPAAAIATLREQARDAQLLAADGSVVASGAGEVSRRPLLTPAQARQAARRPLSAGRGSLLSKRGQHVRVLAVPVRARPGSPVAIAVTAVRLEQRDEALRELLAQLAVANALALALAAAVGYRLARAALAPVERYRAQAQQIAQGATGVRLDVPPGPIDEISRLGHTLNAMLDAQQRAADRQQEFIDDASHELRTPLSTLSVEVDLALRKPRTAAEYQSTLRRIADDTAQLVALAETLLTLGTLGSATPAATAFDVATLVEAAERRARGQLDDGRTVEASAQDHHLVHGDRTLLERAVGNVVDNACRYGAGTVFVRADALEGGATPGTIVTVRDEGDGIPGSFLPHAAERFRQHESSRNGPGAGLGLSLVEAILTAHHGQLRVCSAGRHHHGAAADPGLGRVACLHPDAGTTVSLLLPGSPARQLVRPDAKSGHVGLSTS